MTTEDGGVEYLLSVCIKKKRVRTCSRGRASHDVCTGFLVCRQSLSASELKFVFL